MEITEVAPRCASWSAEEEDSEEEEHAEHPLPHPAAAVATLDEELDKAYTKLALLMQAKTATDADHDFVDELRAKRDRLRRCL